MMALFGPLFSSSNCLRGIYHLILRPVRSIVCNLSMSLTQNVLGSLFKNTVADLYQSTTDILYLTPGYEMHILHTQVEYKSGPFQPPNNSRKFRVEKVCY